MQVYQPLLNLDVNECDQSDLNLPLEVNVSYCFGQPPPPPRTFLQRVCDSVGGVCSSSFAAVATAALGAAVLASNIPTTLLGHHKVRNWKMIDDNANTEGYPYSSNHFLPTAESPLFRITMPTDPKTISGDTDDSSHTLNTKNDAGSNSNNSDTEHHDSDTCHYRYTEHYDQHDDLPSFTTSSTDSCGSYDHSHSEDESSNGDRETTVVAQENNVTLVNEQHNLPVRDAKREYTSIAYDDNDIDRSLQSFRIKKRKQTGNTVNASQLLFNRQRKRPHDDQEEGKRCSKKRL